MSKETIQEKIARLRAYYTDPEDQQKLMEAERELKKIIALSGLTDHDAIKMLVKEDQNTIDGINFVLQNDENLSDLDRIKLIERRKAYEFHLSRFGGDERKKRLESIESFLDTHLKRMQ